MTPPRLPTGRIIALLNEELALDATRLIALRSGAWSAAYAFVSQDREWVVRFSQHGDDFDRDLFAHRFASPALPVPRVVKRGTWDGVEYAVSVRAPGGFLDDLDNAGLRETLPSLLDALEALRTADVSTTSGFGGWDAQGNGTHPSWPGFLLESLQDSPEYRGGSWRRALEMSATGASAFDRDLRVLERYAQGLPNLRHVVHCDLLNFNVLVNDDAISGVIDWGCAIYGDFLYELAWFDFWWPWYSQWDGIDVKRAALDRYAAAGADLRGVQERILAYKLHIGLGHQAYNASIGNWVALETVTQATTSIANEMR